jgi:hypothetical protein
VDASVLATTCAFCDTPLVDAQRAAETVDRVAPFVVPRERAAASLAAHLASHLLAPEKLRRAALPDELRPVLIPFYAFDAVARSRFTCEIGIRWTRTETYTETEDGKTVTKTRTITETEWFPFEGTHAKSWLDHLVSASRGLAEAEANALEPFDLGQCQPFAPALTAGFEAEHPTVPRERARDVAAQELANLEARVIAERHLPGDTHRELRSASNFDIQQVELVLLPVWIAAFAGSEGPVRLLVNGQTGEVVGAIPRSTAKIVALVVIVLAVILAIALLVAAASGVLAAVAS